MKSIPAIISLITLLCSTMLQGSIMLYRCIDKDSQVICITSQVDASADRNACCRGTSINSKAGGFLYINCETCIDIKIESNSESDFYTSHDRVIVKEPLLISSTYTDFAFNYEELVALNNYDLRAPPLTILASKLFRDTVVFLV